MNSKLLTKIDKSVVLLFSVGFIYLFHRLLFDLMESFFNNDYIKGFTVIFISIILEALPFILIGILISSFIHIFISDGFIAKIIPNNKLIGLLCASAMGIIFPVCECAIVPIMRRLVSKGVPIDIAVTFMLAVPIVNPVVLVSTYYAFSGQIEFVLLRAILGMLGAILVGYIMGRINEGSVTLQEQYHSHGHSCSCEEHNNCNKTLAGKMTDMLNHATSELYDVGKYLIMGAFLATIMQIIIPREALLSLGGGKIVSIIVMMIMAFVLSLCSEADAFIARTFLGQFTNGSIVAFLILGPMIDIKNTLMLYSAFKPKFIIKLILSIFIVCFIFALMMNVIGI